MAAARMDGEGVGAAPLAMGPMAAPPGGSSTGGTALAVGEPPGAFSAARAIAPEPWLVIRSLRLFQFRVVTDASAALCPRSTESEKRGGAGRGNWGTDAEEIKE